MGRDIYIIGAVGEGKSGREVSVKERGEAESVGGEVEDARFELG